MYLVCAANSTRLSAVLENIEISLDAITSGIFNSVYNHLVQMLKKSECTVIENQYMVCVNVIVCDSVNCTFIDIVIADTLMCYVCR